MRERQILYDLSYIWNLKNKNNPLPTPKTKKPIDTENRLAVNRGSEGKGVPNKWISFFLSVNESSVI